MDTVIEKGTIVTASYMSEAIGAGGHNVFAGGLDTTAHPRGERGVGAGADASEVQSTIRWQED
jgi:formylmethanofuran dehydrogenase subunit A